MSDSPARSGGTAAAYTVRALRDIESLHRCEDVQQAVWGMGDREVVPYHQLVAARQAGGLILGAYAPDGSLVGFAYAFPGFREGRVFWYSHMTGVLPAHQAKGAGFALKCAQREAALAAGVERIVWTYDPLQAGNARFNFGRLGVLASRYHTDYYGAVTAGLNRGLPTDRFEVDWALRSPRVIARLAGTPAGEPPPDLPWVLAAEARDALAGPAPPRFDLEAGHLLVEIPPDLTRLKTAAPAAAGRWRKATRAVFGHYFRRGYVVTEAVGLPDAHGRRIAYLVDAKGEGL